jgi:hypothetical protein
MGQDLLRRIDESRKARHHAPGRLESGGGSELALCGDTIVANRQGQLRLPGNRHRHLSGLGRHAAHDAADRCGAGALDDPDR